MLEILREDSNQLEDIERLTKDLHYKLNPGHCYTIITDPLYEPILKEEFFKGMQKYSYFIVNVPFNEDMYSPDVSIKETLMEARKSGRKLYLIYLSNGIQMQRFVRYIDE